MMSVPSRPGLATVGALLLSMSAGPTVSAPLEKPEAFLRRVYARYRNDGPGVEMARPAGTPFYTAGLLDAFTRDLASGGATIDWDPICDCQAYDKFRIKSLLVTGEQTDTVKAQIVFMNLGSMRTVTLTLSRTSAGWRIADVIDKGEKSIVTLLQQANTPQSQPSGADTSRPKP